VIAMVSGRPRVAEEPGPDPGAGSMHSDVDGTDPAAEGSA